MSYRSFGVYVHRIRRRLARKAPVESKAGSAGAADARRAIRRADRARNTSVSFAATDPYASAREQRRLKRESGSNTTPFPSTNTYSNERNLHEQF